MSRGTRDIGLRVALGAERRDVLRMIFGHGLDVSGAIRRRITTREVVLEIRRPARPTE